MIYDQNSNFSAGNALYSGFGAFLPEVYVSLGTAVTPTTPTVTLTVIPQTARGLTFVERLEVQLGEEELVGITIDRAVATRMETTAANSLSIEVERRLGEDDTVGTVQAHSQPKTGPTLGLMRRLGG